MLKKLVAALAAVIIICGVGIFYTYKQTDNFLQQKANITQPQLFTISTGMSFRGVVHTLSQKGWFKNNHFVRLIPHLYPELKEVKAGTYQLKPDTTMRAALLAFNKGEEHQFAITFVEGSTFKEWRAQMQASPYIRHTITGRSEEVIAAQLKIPHKKLEGLFLAETYHYTNGTTDIDILRRAHRKLEAVLNKYWQTRAKDLPLKTSYDALILASIVEKETAVDSERERVASVFVNRLHKRMRLQTDPTVIYGMGDKYDGNIRKRDLRTPTPYNTYVISGLPPTPIAMPGLDSIRAALQPEKSHYLYFVASGDGGHVFSKTLAQHNRAVQAYLKKLRNK